MFAELCSAAKIENPQPSIEKFLELQDTLVQATSIAIALAGPENLHKEEISSELNHTELEYYRNISVEKGRMADLWVSAALSIDMASFSLMSRLTDMAVKKDSVKNNAALVLERTSINQITSGISSRKGVESAYLISANEKKTLHMSEGGEVKQSSVSSKTIRPISKRLSTGIASSKVQSTKLTSRVDNSSTLSWMKGDGLQENAQLAKKIQNESQTWFLKFLEGALDNGFHISNGFESVADASALKSSPQDKSQIASMLSQLKRVNDWLDQVGCGKYGASNLELVDTVTRLRRKIYNYLLQHVESAAVALGSQS